jgi:hypothetical protein
MVRNLFSRFFKTIATVVVLFFFLPLSAQAQFTVKLRLIDDKTSEPVPFATASLTAKGSTSATKYVLTDDHGHAAIAKVSKGTYTLKAEIMGYKTYTHELVVDKNVNVGDIRMVEDAVALDAAKVSAVGNPIVIKKDTVEYNASSFKTSDNDMLEQLLKKLPGVEVEADGSITANGQTIKKITIDGKTFFLDDPQLASKNIPAKIIDKVKVVEKKSDQAMFTGIDDGEEETIIDLKLRPGMAEGWFGNVMAGGGHDIPGAGLDMDDWRYQGAAMVGRFTEKSQLSIILNGNNTNNRGFNDVAGSMMGNMRGGRGMGQGMGGWGRNNGISTSWMGGLNGAFTLLDGNMDLAGNYLYNGSDKLVEEETSKITYMEDGSRLLSDEKGHNTTFTQGNRFGVRLEHKFSEKTSILFEPQFNFGAGHFNEFADFSTANLSEGASAATKVNDGYNSNTGANKNWSTSGFLLFRQKLGKDGRTISANIRYSFSDNNLDGYNRSLTNTYAEDGVAAAADPTIVNQYFDQNSKSTSLSGRLVYTEPIAKNLFLEANYSYSWNKNTSDKITYNSASDLFDENGMLIYNPVGQIEDPTYSNDILNLSQNHRAGMNLSYQLKKFRAQLGLSANPTITHNETNGETYDNKVVNWAPQAMLFYTPNDNLNLRMFYFGRSAQPSTSQLMPVPDNSDPLNISLGNPYLQPYFNHSIRGRFGYTNKQTFTSVNANFGGSFVEDALTTAKWYDSDARQYSIPVNGPTKSSYDLRLFVNSPFGKSDFSIFSMTFANYNESVSYIGTSAFQKFEADKYYDAESATFDYEQFHNDFPNLDKTDKFSRNKTQTLGVTQRLRFTYRSDIVELNVGGRTRMSKSWYTIQNSNQQYTWNNQVDMGMNWTIPGGINLIADFNYNWYNGYTTPQEDEIILNAEITKLLFKKKFTLAVKAYDILGQSKNLSVSDNGNIHKETRNNTLGRYIIVSLTYRFGNFNQGGGRRGPGGYGGGPRGPMGGGPRR